MPVFAYTARDEAGKKISGTLPAETQEELAERLEELQLFLVSAKEVHAARTYTLFKRVNRRDLLTFTLYLSTLITAGVPLLVGLRQIADQTKDPYFKKVINEMADDIQGGHSISESMEKHPKVFNELYVSVIKAGEASGNLELVLNDLATFLEWQGELTKSIKKATVYPCVLLGAVGGLVIILITFVFPRFMGIFGEINIELPLPTRVVMSLSDLFNDYGLIMLGVMAILTVSYFITYRYEKGRVLIDKYKMRLPIIGEVIMKISISRFAHYLGVMLRAGIDVTKAFAIVEKLVGNAAIASVVRSMREMIIGGQKISQAMERYHEFPPLVVQMISVGEMSGKLEDNLSKISMFYDREVPEAIDKTLGALQPLLIIFLAGVVIMIALSIFLPMFQMAGALKRG
jgi:type IV pilus assembly protein PilC